ncbi:MMPL family transporter [soil metagenome]
MLSPAALARSSARHPWRTVVVWLAGLVAAVALTSAFLGDALTTSADFTNTPESVRALELIEGYRGQATDTELVVVTSPTLEVADPAYADYVARLQAAIEALGPDTVSHVGSFLTEDGPVAESGRATLLAVTLSGTEIDVTGEQATTLHQVVAGTSAPDGIGAMVTGPSTLSNEFNEIAEEDLRTGESIGVIVALLVLVFVFGTVAAGVIPIVLGVAAIVVALGLAALVGLVFDLSFFVTNMISMIGLAVGIDYSLFVVSRYREERGRGLAKIDAITHAGATAGRAVLWSGLTVVLALVGMLLLPNTIFRSLGIGAILVVIVAVAASMTLLPAVLSLMGEKVDALRIRGRSARSRERQGRFWDRITHAVMDRPVISLVVAGGVLVVLALPYFSITTGFAGVSTLPDEIESKQAFIILEEEFSGGLGSPVEIVVDGAITAEVDRAIAALQTRLATLPAFGGSTVDVAAADDLAIVSAPLNGDINSDASLGAVRSLRADIVPATFAGTGVEVLVGGETAVTVDFVGQTDTYTPIVFAFVLALSFLLLTVAFRSVVIPVKAILLNLLSVGAAYGMVVAFFQQGVGPEWVKSIAGGLGFDQVEAIEAWLPLFLFSVLFGLSMDYHVFLLSRIREQFDRTGDNTASVAYGLRTTGAVITGAAAIMVAVFAGFAAGRLVSFQQMGFGLAVAVLLDATIVRTVLVPASMKLLGERNWYLPSWLQWLPHLEIEGRPEPIEETGDLVGV